MTSELHIILHLYLSIGSFVGETPELEAVLGLFSERLDKGVAFDKFTKILKNHVLKTSIMRKILFQ